MHNIIGTGQESRGSQIITAAGSASGALIIGIILSLMAVIAVVILCFKHRQKTVQLTSNVAYTGRCTTKDIDYYAVSQPLAEGVVSNVETKDKYFVTGNTTANESTKDQPLYDTIKESQLTVTNVSKLDEKVLHRNIETRADNQPPSLLYDTIKENTTEGLQSGSSQTPFTMKEFPDIKAEPELLVTTENVAYNSSYSSSVKSLQPYEGAPSDSAVHLVQNVAYKPTTVPLLPNIVYESHIHQGTENQDEYEYI